MHAAIITAAGQPPVYGTYAAPAARDGHIIVDVRAAALSPFSKSRSAGAHYSADGVFPAVAGAEGVGVAPDGQRVYFALPAAPYGALAEQTLVRARQCVPVPDALDDVTAAAIANPGMSAWAALTARAQLEPGQTVLVNGATGTAGRLAVQIARHLGAGKVIATGRDARALAAVGADVAVPFDLREADGAERYEHALIDAFAGGVDVVLDYLWGASARAIIVAIARAIDDAAPVRFVLLDAIARVFAAVGPARLQIATRTFPLAAIAEAWASPGQPRAVMTLS